MKTDRTTLVLPEELRRKVRRLAAEEGVSMGQFIREAIEERVQRSRRPLRIIGIVSIGGDLGRRSGDEEAVSEPWR